MIKALVNWHLRSGTALALKASPIETMTTRVMAHAVVAPINSEEPRLLVSPGNLGLQGVNVAQRSRAARATAVDAAVNLRAMVAASTVRTESQPYSLPLIKRARKKTQSKPYGVD